jgi:hypothetical protein
MTFNDGLMIETMIAAAHDGTVYILNIGDGIRIDLSDASDRQFFRTRWGRLKRNYGGKGAVAIIAEETGWNFYVR